MRGGDFLKVKEGRVGFRKMTSAERYCGGEQIKNIQFLKCFDNNSDDN